MTHVSDIISALESRKKTYSLDQVLYSSELAHQLDLEHIFYKRWLFAIAACEIAESGSYVTYQVGAYSVIILRDKSGDIKAFHNTCRHRGAVICPKNKGRSKLLTCPYHHWTYNLDGSLIAARDMGEDFNKADFPLKPVHVGEVAGLIYICLADTPPDFAEFHDGLLPYLQVHDLENAKVAYETEHIEQGNWKLVLENNRECYHCRANHPDLCRTFPEDPAFVGDVEGLMPESLTAYQDKCDAVGLPHRFLQEEEGGWRMVRMPLLGDSQCYTMDGKPASKVRLGSVGEGLGALLLYHYPTTWNHFMGDHSIVFRITPIGPNETRLVTKWLVHKDAVEGQDYDVRNLTEVWDATNREDKKIVELNQQGINSPAYQPGPYSYLHESGTNQFVDWYCEQMKKELMD